MCAAKCILFVFKYGTCGIVTIFLQPESITVYICCIICFELTFLTFYTCKRITFDPAVLSYFALLCWFDLSVKFNKHFCFLSL